MTEERLDKIILERGWVSTRTRCERIIKEFGVLVNGKLEKKPGKKFPTDSDIQLLSEEIPWVSRGALKLDAARKEWKLDFTDKVVMDIGASTGGFTEVALENGAKKVFCVDVGTSQLHEKIASHPNIINLEQTHVRSLTHELIDEMVDCVVIDVSFISLEKVIPFCLPFLKEDGVVIALIKPQFEAGKDKVGKGGIVKDTSIYPTIIEKIKLLGDESNLQTIGVIDSPILGGDGNKEFLIYFKKRS